MDSALRLHFYSPTSTQYHSQVSLPQACIELNLIFDIFK